MGFSSNSLQVESVTPEKAEEFLKANYAHQRRVRLSSVEYLWRISGAIHAHGRSSYHVSER